MSGNITGDVDGIDLDNITHEQLKDCIQHAYNLGYAKGLVDNLKQWENAIEKAFANYAQSVTEVYKEKALSKDILIVNVYYSYKAFLKEIDILVVMPETNFETQFTAINKENVFYKNVIGSKLGININIRCMSDSDLDESSILADYPNKIK